MNMIAFNSFAVPVLYSMTGNEFVATYFTAGQHAVERPEKHATSTLSA
jgi:hypothetical protein